MTYGFKRLLIFVSFSFFVTTATPSYATSPGDVVDAVNRAKDAINDVNGAVNNVRGKVETQIEKTGDIASQLTKNFAVDAAAFAKYLEEQAKIEAGKVYASSLSSIQLGILNNRFYPHVPSGGFSPAQIKKAIQEQLHSNAQLEKFRFAAQMDMYKRTFDTAQAQSWYELDIRSAPENLFLQAGQQTQLGREASVLANRIQAHRNLANQIRAKFVADHHPGKNGAASLAEQQYNAVVKLTS